MDVSELQGPHSICGQVKVIGELMFLARPGSWRALVIAQTELHILLVQLCAAHSRLHRGYYL